LILFFTWFVFSFLVLYRLLHHQPATTSTYISQQTFGNDGLRMVHFKMEAEPPHRNDHPPNIHHAIDNDVDVKRLQRFSKSSSHQHHKQTPHTPSSLPTAQFAPLNQSKPLPAWCPHQPVEPVSVGEPHLVASCVYTRIYPHDLSAISRLDLLHWLTYYRYAGVQRVYIYDCWRTLDERLKEFLQPAIDSGFVVYVDWHDYSTLMIRYPTGDHVRLVEVPARTHCLHHYGRLFRWVLHTDVDEFPFAAADTQPGFLTRFLTSSYVTSQAGVTEHTMANYLMLGWRNYSQGVSVMHQVQRRTLTPGNQLVKPIVLAEAISSPTVHHNGLKHGISQEIPHDKLVMNHYWGGRLQDWQPEMPEDVEQRTEPDDSMLSLAEAILPCALTN
jgi:hypothetical protein